MVFIIVDSKIQIFSKMKSTEKKYENIVDMKKANSLINKLYSFIFI